MALPSSRRKSGTAVSPDTALRLLRDGAVIDRPKADLLPAMDHLAGLGLVDAERREYVLCANTQDRDFPPRVRDCRGRIILRDGADEAGHDYCCPDCSRPVFPNRYQKRRFSQWHVSVLRTGVGSYLASRLSAAGLNDRPRREGVWEVETAGGRATLCIVDYCGEERVLAREWAAMNPTLYLTVGPQEREWLLTEPWLKHIRLADIVSGEADLALALADAAETGRPASLGAASIPIYTKGARPIRLAPVETVHPDRTFTVAMGPSTVLVNSVTVIHKQASTALIIFGILWRRFLDNLKNGYGEDDFPPMRVDDLADAVAEKNHKEVEDAASIQRTVNRIQANITETVKKHTGAPIGPGDIIQTIRRYDSDGEDYGFRINPVSVMPRLFSAVAPDLSKEK